MERTKKPPRRRLRFGRKTWWMCERCKIRRYGFQRDGCGCATHQQRGGKASGDHASTSGSTKNLSALSDPDSAKLDLGDDSVISEDGDDIIELGPPVPAAGPSGYALPPKQHRLLYHMSAISASIEACQSSNLVIYMKRLPIFLKIGFSYDFVMHSLMSWAASHQAFANDSREAHVIARQYRTLAMHGLRSAVSEFGERNSDAVLCASLLLSWQAADPMEWATFNKGTSAVISAMEPWRHNSLLAEHIDEEDSYVVSPNVITYAFNVHTAGDEIAALTYIYEAVERVEHYARGRPELLEIVHHLMNFVANVKSHVPISDPRLRFYLLEPTRSMLYWLPARFVEQAQKDPVVMVVLAHLYAISLTVQPVFAGPGAAHFRGLSTAPIEDIYQRLLDMHSAAGRTMETFIPVQLMHFPMQSVALFRSRMGLGDAVVHADQSLTAIRYGLDPLVEAVNAIDIREVE